MDYSRLCCEECIVYQVRHHLANPDTCYKCGQNTLQWIQNEYGTMQITCSECGEKIYVDMNTPCENECDSLFDCYILPQKTDLKTILVISRLTGKPSPEVLNLMKTDGVHIKDNFFRMCSELISLDKTGISYTVEPYDPRYKYTYIKKCGYPYRPIWEEW